MENKRATSPGNLDEHVSGVANLRVRLLEEARRERDRCLRDSDSLGRRERQQLPSRCFTDASVQTQPNITAKGWSREDEEAQAEAIQTIQRLTIRGTGLQLGEAGLRAESVASSAATQRRQAATEQRLAAAAREQVKCLELELDNKESAIRVLERTLESRDKELHLTQMQVRRLLWRELENERDNKLPPGADPNDFARFKALREQVLDLECQLHQKGLELARLSGSEGPPSAEKGAPAADEESTRCGSEWSVAAGSGSSTIGLSSYRTSSGWGLEAHS